LNFGLEAGEQRTRRLFETLVDGDASLGFGGHKSALDLCATLVHNFDMPVTLTQRRTKKPERLVARVSAEDKELISQAAAIAGQSVGSFILSEARKAAVQTLETRQRIVLNAKQSRRLVEALLAPPRPPTPRMKRALEIYRKTVISDVNV
jgi:uncharacterized protein (DUF1778 family)